MIKSLYFPEKIEKKIYNFWEKNSYFTPKNNIKKKNFCIVMPPPNITGSLHMGHAFQHTIMDIIIRYNRMQGKNTLWQVGIDHAGIATQIVVEDKLLRKTGKNRYFYGKKKFIKKIWDWYKKYKNIIFNQMRRLGNSVFWENKRFTLDYNYSKSVKNVFIFLYKNNLIYKRKKISNWDIKLQTVISDIEVKHKKIKGKMWYIKYLIFKNVKKKNINSDKYIVVGTTRPETLLGDVAIIINPNDFRYKKFIGYYAIVPLVNRIIPIISDKYADIEKGTGCVKITPGHDFNDYKIGIKYNLPIINFMNKDGTIRKKSKIYNNNGFLTNYYNNFIPKIFHNLDRLIVRKKIINIFKKKKILKKINTDTLTVPYGERSGVLIEPILTNQWYLSVDKLSKIAKNAIKKNKIIFIQKKYKKNFFYWVKNINDWCISRQLWWGHKIPVWYDNFNNIYVGKNKKNIRKKYFISKKIKLYQDSNVLDTWFSSSLWTFASLGWPKITNLFKNFHITDVIVSGFDIIFFWIIRMIMITMYIIKNSKKKSTVPFKNIYITGLIRDSKGKKMSKSKGNVIDPLDLIDGISFKKLIKKRSLNIIDKNEIKKIYKNTKKYFPNGINAIGTDSLRFIFCKLSTNNNFINFDFQKLKSCRNFCIKLWNASRFVLINLNNLNIFFKKKKYFISIIDKWIFIKFNKIIKKYRNYLNNYRFDYAVNILYNFFKNNFCDWYLELCKPIIYSNEKYKIGTIYTMLYILELILRLAHPILPFLTEYIWKKLKKFLCISGNTIMLQKFPKYKKNILKKKKILKSINLLKKIIISLRKIRLHTGIKNNIYLSFFLKTKFKEINYILLKYGFFLKKLYFIKRIIVLRSNDLIPISITFSFSGLKLFFPLLLLVKKNKEIKRIKNICNKLLLKINIIKKTISNILFIKNASKKIINKYFKNYFLFKKQLREIIKQYKIILKL